MFHNPSGPDDLPPNMPGNYRRAAVRLAGAQVGVTYHVRMRVRTSRGQVIQACGDVMVQEC